MVQQTWDILPLPVHSLDFTSPAPCAMQAALDLVDTEFRLNMFDDDKAGKKKKEDDGLFWRTRVHLVRHHVTGDLQFQTEGCRALNRPGVTRRLLCRGDLLPIYAIVNLGTKVAGRDLGLATNLRAFNSTQQLYITV